MKNTIPILSIVLLLSIACSNSTKVTSTAATNSTSVQRLPKSTVKLIADGSADAYAHIDKILGGTAYEVPDCSHPDFGKHIREQYDSSLQENIFVFSIHVKEDNDRCINMDRQRNEIKTYGPSPDNIKAFNGDAVVYKWKFKLDQNFKPSPGFTHIHQIKAGDGDAGAPLITLTPRFGKDGDRIEVININSIGITNKLTDASLSQFKGNWVEVTESITFGSTGKYSISINRIKDGRNLLSYSTPNVDLWRKDTQFCRPKWGIYRSLKNSEYLRDEEVSFADFELDKM